jgi:hypothetical protein
MHIEVLSYAEEKRNRLSWEYGEAKVDEVDEKMKPLWENLSLNRGSILPSEIYSEPRIPLTNILNR